MEPKTKIDREAVHKRIDAWLDRVEQAGAPWETGEPVGQIELTAFAEWVDVVDPDNGRPRDIELVATFSVQETLASESLR